MARVFGAAMVLAMTQKLLPGKGPDESKDFIYPQDRSDEQGRDGGAVGVPTYLVHDVAPLFNRSDVGPFRSVQNALGTIPASSIRSCRYRGKFLPRTRTTAGQ
jgi:hypothetical protein